MADAPNIVWRIMADDSLLFILMCGYDCSVLVSSSSSSSLSRS